MGLVTDDLSEWLAEPEARLEENPFGAGFAQSVETPPHTRWRHTVRRLRKWLRTELDHHGEHEDGLTR
jgi:hypothetical protein